MEESITTHNNHNQPQPHSYPTRAREATMGLSEEQHDELIKGLQPKLPATPVDKPDTEVEIDRSGFMDPEVQRGFPICGQRGFPGGATMRGTRPGDPVTGLEQAGTLILQGLLKRTRRKDYP